MPPLNIPVTILHMKTFLYKRVERGPVMTAHFRLE